MQKLSDCNFGDRNQTFVYEEAWVWNPTSKKRVALGALSDY